MTSLRPFAAAVAAALVLGFVPSAEASTNVVSNPGFEQGGCGVSTPILCGWRGDASDAFVSQDMSNPHTGAASMHLECGLSNCVYDPESGFGYTAVSASTCVQIGPGAHAASFWYRDAVGARVSLDMRSYYDRACTNEVGQDSLAQPASSAPGWHQVSGVLHGATYTQSARVSLSIEGSCDVSCAAFAANFDDVNLDDVGDPKPAITSFTPATGWFGTRVWIYGFDFLGATSVTFNGVPAQFSVTDGEIDADVPIGATSGPISVTTANGTAWSSSSFTLVPPPTISSFTPTGGIFGKVVDIHGANFTGAIWVTFNQRYAEFTVDSDSEIHAIVPDGATTGPIAVTTVSGTGSSSSPFAVPTPTITSFTPTSGPFGTVVDIHGTNFSGATIVTFQGTRADFTVDSDSEIHATVPTGASTGWISVATPGGSALTSSSFNVAGGAPSIISFSPMSGPVGTTVDIRGDNLTGATSVKFGNDAASFTVDSDVEIHATVPAPTGATNSYISVVTPHGSATAGALFLVKANAPPSAHFTFTCTALTCSADGSASSDSDGSIQGYSWSFGDGTSGSGRTTDHTYGQAGAYALKLTVTDDAGATATETQTVNLIKLTARGYTVKGLERVDLAWTRPSGVSFEVYRNGGKVATVQAGSYTDALRRKDAGSYTYKVCAPAIATCSNNATVTFGALPTLGSAFAGGARLAAVCPNGKHYKADPLLVPKQCDQTYRGATNKGGKVELKVIYSPSRKKQLVSKFALTATARCSDGKKRKMLQGFRDQVREEGAIKNGRFEMTRKQSDTSRIGVAVKGTVSPRRASGTGSWTYSFQPFHGFKNGVPQYGDTVTCRSGRQRWSAGLVAG